MLRGSMKVRYGESRAAAMVILANDRCGQSVKTALVFRSRWIVKSPMHLLVQRQGI